MQKNKTKRQLELEEIILFFDPGNLHAQAINEYEDEASMFLERINDSMGEEQLLDIMHDVLQKMFNLSDSKESRENIRPIVKRYINFKNSGKAR